MVSPKAPHRLFSSVMHHHFECPEHPIVPLSIYFPCNLHTEQQVASFSPPEIQLRPSLPATAQLQAQNTQTPDFDAT
jgi:hypothetical protein